MSEVRLLTEAEWLHLLSSDTTTMVLAHLRERGLIAPELGKTVDDIVREEMAKAWEVSEPWTAKRIREGRHNHGPSFIAGARLYKMGMELAPAARLTRDGLEAKIYEALTKAEIYSELDRYDFGPTGFTTNATKFADALHAALTRETPDA